MTSTEDSIAKFAKRVLRMQQGLPPNQVHLHTLHHRRLNSLPVYHHWRSAASAETWVTAVAQPKCCYLQTVEPLLSLSLFPWQMLEQQKASSM